MKKNLFLFIALFLFSFYLQTQEFKFITHELKPFTWIDENNNLKGLVYDLCNETIKRLGYNSDNIELMPFPRALKTVMEEDNYILFHVSKTVEREDKLKWVGPIISTGVYFYKLKQNKAKMDSVDDMKKLGQIGVGRGNASEAVLLKNDFTNLYAVTNEISAIEMLVMGRVDAVLIGEIVMSEMAKNANIDITLLIKTNLKMLDSILYMGFSKNISDTEIEKWQSVFDKVKAEKFEGLYKKYIENTK